jgi:hypothetical protein
LLQRFTRVLEHSPNWAGPRNGAEPDQDAVGKQRKLVAGFAEDEMQAEVGRIWRAPIKT